MTETRQETAADYLQAAAEKLHTSAAINEQYGVPGDRRAFDRAVADWLYDQAEAENWALPSTPGSHLRLVLNAHQFRALAVAAAVLGRSWPS